VPIIVGVIVLLGAAGAVVTIGRTVKQTGSVTPADTTTRIVAPRPVDTASRTPVAPPRRSPVKRPGAPATRPRIDIARAQELLDTLYFNRLVPKTARMVRDSAIHIFNAPGITTSDSAYAAFVFGMALAQMNDRERGCEWVRKARDLNPTDSTYAKILARC
jgi:hypothetical protein